jgi:hypothetical protein
MKKQIMAAVACVFFLLGLAPTFADAASTLRPAPRRWSNVSDIILSLEYESGMVEWHSTIYGEPNTTKISATFTLYKKISANTYSWLGSWNASSNSLRLSTSGSVEDASGMYKISVTAKVTRNGFTETVDNSFEASVS